jgi:hypothetical protein
VGWVEKREDVNETVRRTYSFPLLFQRYTIQLSLK